MNRITKSLFQVNSQILKSEMITGDVKENKLFSEVVAKYFFVER